MKTKDKTLAPRTEAIRIALSKVVFRDDMKVRNGSLSPYHVTELRQAVNRGSKLPPVLVWQEMNEHGPTGRFVILDGRHRIAALRKDKPKLTEVMAEVFTGSKVEALLMAASRNTKVSLPLTRREAANVAWAVVRMDQEPYRISKPQIARECGVSTGLVGAMRAKWKAWPNDSEPSGDWQRDKREGLSGGDDWDPDEAEKLRQELIDKAASEVLAALGKLIKTDSDAAWEAIARALGHRISYLVDYLSDPEDDLPATGLEGDFYGVDVGF